MEYPLNDLDEDILHELIDTIAESLDEIEISLENLNANPGNNEILNDLFRILHSVKGNFRVCFLMPFSNYVHAIEETFSEIRSGRLSFTPVIKEITLLALDKLRAHMALIGHADSIDTEEMEQISHHFLTVATADADKADDAASKLLEFITGNDSDTLPIAVELPANDSVPAPEVNTQGLDDDIRYFQTVAFLMEGRVPFWVGRTQRLLGIVTAVSGYLPYKIDRQQMQAAMYIHDIGMVFLPDEILHSKEKLSEQQRAEVIKHPHIGYQFLNRLQHWQEASQIVLQHHERLDGTGYPNGLKGDEICNGAKLLAVADAFCSLTSERADRSRRRSVLRALMEINNNVDTQFDNDTVVAFTNMARDIYRQ